MATKELNDSNVSIERIIPIFAHFNWLTEKISGPCMFDIKAL